MLVVLKVKAITFMRKLISKKIPGLVLGVVFVVAAFFGAHLTMQMDPQGVMQNCPLLGHVETVCTMKVTEHIAKWHQLFTATMSSNKFLFAVVLFMSFAFIVFSFRFSLLHQLHFQTFKRRAGPPEYSSGFLLRALGRGILRKRE